MVNSSGEVGVKAGPQSTRDSSWTPLMRAAADGDAGAVRMLLEAEVRTGQRNRQGMTALMHAAQQGHTSPVKSLVEKERGFQDKNGWTALMHAAYNNHPEVVEILIPYNCGERDKNGRTALMMAAEIVSLLAPHEEGLKDSRGSTALMIAAQQGSLEIVKALVEHEKGLEDGNDCTALVHAARAGHRDVAELLMTHEGDAIGWTTLMLAAGLVSQYLSERGQRDRRGLTALILAAQNGRDEAVELLMEHESDVSGWTDLVYSAYLGDGDGVKENIYEKGHTDITGMTALMWAAHQGHKGAVEILVKHEKGLKDKAGKTALMHAVSAFSDDSDGQAVPAGASMSTRRGSVVSERYEDRLQCIELLGEHEARMRDTSRRTALMMAAECGHGGYVKKLLDKEGGMSDSDGRTALMREASNGHTEMVRLLVEMKGSALSGGAPALPGPGPLCSAGHGIPSPASDPGLPPLYGRAPRNCSPPPSAVLCDVCGEELLDSDDIDHHIETHGPTCDVPDDPLPCPEAEPSDPPPDPAYPFPCTVCRAKYKTRRGLDAHMDRLGHHPPLDDVLLRLIGIPSSAPTHALLNLLVATLNMLVRQLSPTEVLSRLLAICRVMEGSGRLPPAGMLLKKGLLGRASEAIRSEAAPHSRIPEPSGEERARIVRELHPLPPAVLLPEVQPMVGPAPRVTGQALLQELKAMKAVAAGPSGLGRQHLLFLCERGHAADLFADALRQLYTSRDWGKLAPLCEFRLKLIPKQGGKWRPIAVQETLLVAFHRLILKQTPSLRRLPDWQLAFAPLAQVKAIRRAEELKRDHHLLTVDVKNAFNSVPHPVLLFALHRARVPVSTVSYVESFLLARHAADLPSVPAGVPQGDPLSMAMFCHSLTWPVESFLSQYKVLAYADDMILASSPSVPASTVVVYILVVPAFVGFGSARGWSQKNESVPHKCVCVCRSAH